MNEVLSALGTLAALCPAGAASFAAWFTYQIMKSGQKQVEAALQQVEVSQQEVRAAREAQQDGQLPILMPSEPLLSAGYGSDDGYGHYVQPTQPGYDHNQPFVRVQIRNAGPGLALNIRGIVFGPRPEFENARVIDHCHSHTYPVPLPAGATSSLDWKRGGSLVSGDTRIGTHTLYAPTTPSASDKLRGIAELVGRLTLTYSDIYGRKHATIYDLTADFRWVAVDYIPNIAQDLGELARDALKAMPVYKAPPIPHAEP